MCSHGSSRIAMFPKTRRVAMRPPIWPPPLARSPAAHALVSRIRRAKLFLFLRHIHHRYARRPVRRSRPPYAVTGPQTSPRCPRLTWRWCPCCKRTGGRRRRRRSQRCGWIAAGPARGAGMELGEALTCRATWRTPQPASSNATAPRRRTSSWVCGPVGRMRPVSAQWAGALSEFKDQ
jgi:hypothetical protein